MQGFHLTTKDIARIIWYETANIFQCMQIRLNKGGIMMLFKKTAALFLSAALLCSGIPAGAADAGQYLPVDDSIRGIMHEYGLYSIGKTVISEDLTDPAESFLASQYDFGYIDNLTGTGIQFASFEIGKPIHAEGGGMFERYYEYCGENHIPVVTGDIISRDTIRHNYLLDDSGAYAAPEVVNERFAENVQETFRVVKEFYPQLKLKTMVVCSWFYSGFPEERLEKIYKGDYTSLYSAVYSAAAQSAPEGCKLYVKEMFPDDDAALQDMLTAVSKARETEGCRIDGLMLDLAFGDAPEWDQRAPFFAHVLKEISDQGLECGLLVTSGSNEPYFDDCVCDALNAGFSDIIQNADRLSFVCMGDHSRFAMDVANPLCKNAGLKDALRNAVNYKRVLDLPPGDINTDGVVDVSDAVMLARVLAEDADVIVPQHGYRFSDANEDGIISQEDVIAILKIIAKLA